MTRCVSPTIMLMTKWRSPIPPMYSSRERRSEAQRTSSLRESSKFSLVFVALGSTRMASGGTPRLDGSLPVVDRCATGESLPTRRSVGAGENDEREDPLVKQGCRDIGDPEIVAAQPDTDRARPQLVVQLVEVEERPGVFEDVLRKPGRALAHWWPSATAATASLDGDQADPRIEPPQVVGVGGRDLLLGAPRTDHDVCIDDVGCRARP